MRRRIGIILAVLLYAALLAVPAAAESVTSDQHNVVFTADGKLDSDFSGSDIYAAASVLQPGDDLTVVFELRNENAESADWYMTNEVLYSLEDRSNIASGGAYTYLLTYTDTTGETATLFSSETVGGDLSPAAEQGLHEATQGMEDYFYLDSMRTGQKGTITLKVALDGETQGNDYQDTLADMQMNFAVEVGNPQPGETTTGKTIDVVQTGDDVSLLPYYIAMTVSGGLFLLLAFDTLRERRKEAKN